MSLILSAIAQSHRLATVGSPPWASVGSLLHMDDANGSTTFTDEKGVAWTAHGGADETHNHKMFGVGSLDVVTAGSYITAAAQSLMYPFTVEGWMYATTASSIAVIWSETSTNMAAFGHIAISNLSNVLTADIRPADLGTQVLIASSVPSPLNTWVAWAMCIDANGTCRVFQNGVLVGSGSAPAVTFASVGQAYGGYPNALSPTTRSFRGYLDEMRRTNGVALYTKSYRPRSVAFPNS